MSRSLAACEGALLVVDAAQGIEAQTMANVYLALEHDLAIVAVINKIDLPNADPERVSKEVGSFIGLLDDEVIPASAKTGAGVDDILEAIVTKMPPPADAGVRQAAAGADLRLALRSVQGRDRLRQDRRWRNPTTATGCG